MTRVICGLVLSLCCTTAWAQVGIFPAVPQPPAVSAYPLAFPQPYYQSQFFGGLGSYGYGGFGGYGLGGFGDYGIGPFGFAARGYYPPNPFGNLNWLPPNPPSPYYVVPSRMQYLEQAYQRDRSVYNEIMILNSLGR